MSVHSGGAIARTRCAVDYRIPEANFYHKRFSHLILYLIFVPVRKHSFLYQISVPNKRFQFFYLFYT